MLKLNEKNIATTHQKKINILIVFIVTLSCLMGLWNFRLPGLQVDEVNHAAFVPGVLSQNAAQLHHYRLPDNYLDLEDGVYQYPIFGGSFYNSVVTTYLGLPFYEILGFSLSSIRFFHWVIGVLCVLLGSLLIVRFAGFLSAYFFATMIVTNPDFVFSLRSQGAFFWAVVLFALIGIYLLIRAHASINTNHKNWLVFFAGVFFACSLMSYFVGIFIILPILVFAWYSFNKSKRYCLLLLCGLLIGYLPVIYAIISVYLINPYLLRHFGIPDFAILNHIPYLSFENLQRIWVIFKGSLSGFLFTKGIVGNFKDIIPDIRLIIFIITTAFSFWFLSCRKYLINQKALIATTSAMVIVYLIATFALKALSFHHLLPLFFVLIMQISIFMSGRYFLKYLFIFLGLILLLSNVNGLILAHSALEKTGGLGYHNETFTQSAEKLKSECDDCHPVFVSWGIHLQFLFLTDGKKQYSFLPHSTSDTLKDFIYEHKKIALIGVSHDLEKFEFNPKEIIEFNSINLKQRNGVELYKIIMLRSVDNYR